MNSWTRALTAAAFLLATTLSGSASAEAPPGAVGAAPSAPWMHHSPSGGGSGTCPFAQGQAGAGWMAALDDLQLTGEQRQAVQSVFERYRTRGWDLAQRAQGIREQLMGVAPDAPGYAKAVDAASQSSAALAADGVRLLSDMRAELYGILTEEQRARLKERASKERDRWADWRSRHQAPPQ
jgi:Spy/CpxP family protein refolding chaperone